jgi:hypothetical protein
MPSTFQQIEIHIRFDIIIHEIRDILSDLFAIRSHLEEFDNVLDDLGDDLTLIGVDNFEDDITFIELDDILTMNTPPPPENIYLR